MANVTPLSISFNLLQIVSVNTLFKGESSGLTFKEIRTLYFEKFGSTAPSVLQGTLARLRDKGLIETIINTKESSNDISSILKYRVTEDGLKETKESAREIVTAAENLQGESAVLLN